jgi:recombination associated protein RdgC
MWFRNLQVYRLTPNWDITLEALESQLGRIAFQPCAAMEMQSRGWMPPVGRGEEAPLVHAVNRHWLIALGIEQKLLPAAVINQEAAERAAEIEAQEGYKPGRKQMRDIKERVTDELLPRAFVRRHRTFVWIDPVNGWLGIDAASASKAEDILETLNKAVDSLPARLLKTERSPQSAMTDWLVGLAEGEAPSGFSIDRDCELKSVTEEKSAVRYARHTLDGDDVRDHLVGGKLPTRLAMTWNDRISFVLTEKLEIKRLAFLDILKEQADKADNAEEQFDADFALMTGELAKLLPDLVDALGGEISEEMAKPA